MAAAAPHRGTKVELVQRGRCVLGTTDDEGDLSEASLADEADLAVAFAGRLDNQDDLLKELETGGTPAEEATPASVLAAMFRRSGDRAAERLRGVFAAAVSDGERLWVVRDHAGLRSVFYRDDRSGTFVASEAKQVAAGAGISREPDEDVLAAIFFRDLDDETPSAVRGVRRLPKATVLLVDGSGSRMRRYWHPERLLESAEFAFEDIRPRFEALMTQACERMMRGPDCVSLSGGIDSPAVAAFAAPAHERLFGGPLDALSAVYPDQPAVDESELIRLTADRYGMPLHTYERHARPTAGLRRWVDLLDGPVPQILVSDAEEHYTHAARLGLTNTLTGEIAEYLFDLRGPLVPYLLRRGRVAPAVAHLRDQRREHGVGPGPIARQVFAAAGPRWIVRPVLRRRARRPGVNTPPWIDVERATRAAVRNVVATWERWPHLQLGGFVGPGLTMEADEIVQAVCGTRARRPFADVDLWEFFLSMPAEVKFPDTHGKGIMRGLLRGRVPDQILDRRQKTVFDDSLRARIDHEDLGRWLRSGSWRMPGIDYARLLDRVDRRELQVHEYIRAKDLAAAHAFVQLLS